MALQVPDPSSDSAVIPLFIHQGKYPLYDVGVRIFDLDDHRRLNTAAQRNDARGQQAIQQVG
ncbi:hypothetical protein LMTR3_20455 [Bradyrhizobium sp. LMTR 3]|nr:hypothetical protein LMTR3_20455 [Bradyrhizobium sp. LMTR 3]